MRVGAKHHGLVDLEKDLRVIPSRAAKESGRIVRENVQQGGQSARRIAKWTSGRHAKRYPSDITWDRSLDIGTAFGVFRASYGPLPRGQGNLAPILEEGATGKNHPHKNLEQSLDLQRPKFHRDIENMLDGLFWPGGDA